MRRTLLLCVCLLLALLLPPPPRALAHNHTPGPGWVPAQNVTSGCNQPGVCDTQPINKDPSLYEYTPNRDERRRDFDIHKDRSRYDGSKTYPGLSPSSVRLVRQKCWVYNEFGQRVESHWAEGEWRHNGTWGKTNGHWVMHWQGWNFTTNDRCNLDPTATPVPPTATPVPTPTAVPGQLTVVVYKCRMGGDLLQAARIVIDIQGQIREQTNTAQASFTVPTGIAIGIRVDGPAGWGQAWGSGRAGETVGLALSNAAACNAGSSTPTPQPGAPTPTPQPVVQPCIAVNTWDGNRAGLQVQIETAGGATPVPVRVYPPREGTAYRPPAGDPEVAPVPAGARVRVTYDFSTLDDGPNDAKHHYLDHHTGMAALRFGIADLTTGKPVVSVTFVDREGAGEPRSWPTDGRALVVDSISTGNTVVNQFPDHLPANDPTLEGLNITTEKSVKPWGRWNSWSGRFEGRTWGNTNSLYNGDMMGRTDGQWSVIFTPKPGHQYEAWIVNGWGDCKIDDFTWSRARFGAADDLRVQLQVAPYDRPADVTPLGGQRVTASSASGQSWSATTDDRGQALLRWSEIAPALGAGGSLSLSAPTPAGLLPYRFESSCAGAGVLDAARWNGITAPCQLTLTYLRLPAVSARVVRQRDEAGWGTWDPLANVPLALRDARDNAVVAEAISAGDGTVVPAAWRWNPATLRARAGAVEAWRLTAPPEAQGLAFQLVLPGSDAQYDPTPTRPQARLAVGGSLGTVFIYGAAREPQVYLHAVVTSSIAGRSDPPVPVPGATLQVTRNDLRLRTLTSGADGSVFASFPLSEHGGTPMTYTLELQRWPISARAARAEAGGPWPTQVLSPRLVRLQTVPADERDGVYSVGNTFVLERLPDPPAPPTVSGDLRLRLYSMYDPEQGVYLSSGTTVAWPLGETLYWTPAWSLQVPTSSDPLWTYRARVVAWSYVTTTVNGRALRAAEDPDLFGRRGCRPRSAPTETEASELRGCAYRYVEDPSPFDMSTQARTLWVGVPPVATREDTYTYHVAPLRPVGLEIEALVLVEVVPASDPSGPAVRSATQVLRGTATVDLVTPRSVR